MMNPILDKPQVAADETTGQTVIPIAEETARIDKKAVTQRVRVSTTVEEEEKVFEDILNREEIDVERVPINRVVEEMPEIRTQGDVTIVPVVEERVVVSKQLVLVEEVHIHKRRQTQPTRVPVKLRRHRLHIEEQIPGNQDPYSPPNSNRS